MEHDDKNQFLIQRIYVKDASLESPQTPEIFLQPWSPEINLQLDPQHRAMNQDQYEVILQVVVTARDKDKTLFLVEVKQAGIFTIKNFTDPDLEQILAVTCPMILFPYAREVVSDLIARATFPPFYLPPVDFQALSKAKQTQEQNEAV
jgi:preprotein translocase subunit SecB